MGAVIRRLRYLRSCNFYLVLVCGQRYKTAGVGGQCGCYWTDYSIVSLDGCINEHCLGKLSRGVHHVNCHVSNRDLRCLEHCICAPMHNCHSYSLSSNNTWVKFELCLKSQS